MKRIFVILTFVLCLGGLSRAEVVMPEKVDKSTQPRVLITTDLEVDDMNGVILSLMYSDYYDIAGIVWTAGMYHFSGDGGLHTLGEITPHYRCNAQHCGHTVKDAGELRYYRPADPTWLARIADCYEADYKLMSKNNPNFPTPEYIRSVMKEGNIQFEGDYRFETEGSKWIEQCIMDDDERPLVIQHWGGINTTVRALYSIYEKYHDTPEWDAVLAKVVGKVRIGGSGEDYCRENSKIDEMFPGLQDGGYGMGFFSYGSFFSASYDTPSRAAAAELQPYLHADFTTTAYKFNHGKLPEQLWLMGEGRAVFGEPYIYNYGLITFMDWGLSAQQGWGPASLVSYPRANFKPYDWGFCQFGCAGFIDIGLRQEALTMPRPARGAGMMRMGQETRYTQVMWDELAARADWAICEPEDCNHAPFVNAEQLDFTAKAGKTVTLTASAEDPDGDKLNIKWWMPKSGSSYAGSSQIQLGQDGQLSMDFVIPKDAKKGDRFVVNMEVQDVAERPMTRFAQFIVTVGK